MPLLPALFSLADRPSHASVSSSSSSVHATLESLVHHVPCSKLQQAYVRPAVTAKLQVTKQQVAADPVPGYSNLMQPAAACAPEGLQSQPACPRRLQCVGHRSVHHKAARQALSSWLTVCRRSQAGLSPAQVRLHPGQVQCQDRVRPSVLSLSPSSELCCWALLLWRSVAECASLGFRV